MDTDLVSELLTNSEPSTGDLLSNLPHRELTHDSRANLERREDFSFIARPNPNQAGAVIARIEDIFESIADSILHEKKELIIRLRTRRRTKNHNLDPSNSAVRNASDTKLIRFPSKSPQEAWKFGRYRGFSKLSLLMLD